MIFKGEFQHCSFPRFVSAMFKYFVDCVILFQKDLLTLYELIILYMTTCTPAQKSILTVSLCCT